MTDQFTDDLDKFSASLRELAAEATTAAGYLRAELERLHPPTPADSPPPPSPSTPLDPIASQPPPGWVSIGDGKAAEPPGWVSTVIPGTRKPDRDRIYIPDDEMDDDDLYFQEHRRRGWLE